MFWGGGAYRANRKEAITAQGWGGVGVVVWKKAGIGSWEDLVSSKSWKLSAGSVFGQEKSLKGLTHLFA